MLKWKHRLHAMYGHARKDQSRSPAETSSHCKAVGSSSETKHHAWPSRPATNCKTESRRTCMLKWKHRLHAKYGHGRKDQSRSPAETSSHCKAVGSSSETKQHANTPQCVSSKNCCHMKKHAPCQAVGSDITSRTPSSKHDGEDGMMQA